MARICIRFPDQPAITACIEFEDGQDDIPIELRKCKCGCERLFVPSTPIQVHFDDEDRIAYNNKQRQRPTKTPRRRKSA